VNILVSGASGLIGSALVPEFEAAGHTVRRLVRHQPNSTLEIPWRTNQITPNTLQPFDAIVHLAGRNIGARWTASVKQEIRESRLQGTKTLAGAAADAFRTSGKPSVLISVSAVGYYGSRGDEELTEASGSGSGFLAEVCRDWEAATEPAADAGVRVAIPRVGVVLTRRGGALKKILPPFQLGLGGPVGNGRQWMSWVVLDDLIRILVAALDDSRMSGPINAIAPQPVTNLEFAKALGRALRRPAVFPVPAFVVKTMFGKMGEETLLAGGRVLPRKLQELGFTFRHPQIAEALQFAVQH
jgi:uncharacterized protein (TIGR01777 family)